MPAALILIVAAYLFIYNRPIELQKAVLMSTPIMYTKGSIKPYAKIPSDVAAPRVNVFYATDRQPTDSSIIDPLYYSNDRSMHLYLGRALVRFGDADMAWADIEHDSLRRDRHHVIPLEIEKVEMVHKFGSPVELLTDSLREQASKDDPFIKAIKERLSHSDDKSIFLFVPGFKVNFAYPVLVAAELWHYLGYTGAFIAYSWPSRQRIRDYFSDVETAAFTAQNFRMLLLYLAQIKDVEHIHILSYSAGARIVSQALHEIRLMAHGLPMADVRADLKISRVIFTAPDIDMMLFSSRYRDGFADIVNSITIYTNANDTALNWALRFLGWPRLGAPGELGLTPGELRSLESIARTKSIDVSAAEDAASGNGHGYFVKSPWVSTDILLTLKYGTPPLKRGLTRQKDDFAWEFPKSYPETIREAIQQQP
ncbi:MAG: alpha/beta hydrolase [Thermodesulfobacteriota bacterium]